MNAIILSIGDELVLGQTVDTNSAWLSAELARRGCDVLAHATVADSQPAIESAIRAAAIQCDLLIVSGGLGPTADDLTRQAIAVVLDQPLELDDQWLRRMDAFFRRLKRPMPESNRIQAMIPRGARMIENNAGTAAGIEAEYHDSSAGGPSSRVCRIFAIPGVPKEMKLMFQSAIAPQVDAGASGAVILSRTLHTFGMGESAIAQMLGDLMDRARNPSVGTTVSSGLVSLRLNARFADREQALRELDNTAALCRAALGDLIYGQDEQTLWGVVAELLLAAHATVTTAESCTGGSLSKWLTDVSGSSRYFQRGWITYSDRAKTDMLGVPAELLAEHGAVSEPVAAAMAGGARERASADFALAISGVAGPGGGTPQKPVGMVCIALASTDSMLARTFHFPGDREMIRDRSAKMALSLLRYKLLGKPIPN